MDKDSASEKKGTSEANPADEEALSSDEEYSDDESDYSEDDEDEEEEADDRTPEEIEAAEKRKRERRRQRREEEARKQEEEEEDDVVEEEDLWNFPVDHEHWTEEDLGEVWVDIWGDTTASGYDPELLDRTDKEFFDDLRKKGKGPPDSPFYVPYRKFYPLVPENHYDIRTPEDVVEELERIEEFLVWVSYVFKDGSCYEGTVWDDLAHGKGVYTTPLDLCRYEGEWFQNMMQGHGVLEVDLPVPEPIPDSKGARKLKGRGAILKSDYMDPFDKQWMKKDFRETFARYHTKRPPFEDLEAWVKIFGEKPEKGHYKYSGEWKHSRMHGCGVYEINGRLIWGKFYFGELLPDVEECTAEMSAFHSSLAEVAAAKAKMFINKPDGMVRELKGPYTDPSHPYMYEEEDLWMAPGFINAYYEVPEEWSTYVEDLDSEREMWLNSFIKTPLTIPMPPELEYWWSKDDEFVVLGNTPSATLHLNPDNVGRLDGNLQGEVLLHVPSGRIINWAHDSKGRLRFFMQPITKDGEIKPEAIRPLPLGFDEYLEDATDQKMHVVREKGNIFQKFREKWKKYTEEHAEEHHQQMEELENRWKREDQLLEERGRLKEEERKLALEIEEEELYARYLEILEESGISLEETAEGQSGEGAHEQLDSGGAMSTESELVETKVDVKESPEGPEEEDEADEDDKKPRSFGKVAMVDCEGKTDLQGKTDEPKKYETCSPTAFASLSLVHKVVGSRFCQAVSGLFWKRAVPRCRRDCHIKWTSYDDQLRSSSMVAKRVFDCVSFPSSQGNLKLRALCLIQQHAGKDLSGFIYNNAMKAVSLGGIQGRKRHRLKNRSRRAHSLSRGFSCWKNVDSKGIWSKPQFGFLSMALPLEM